ncbi:hypothetical protein AgCh_035713 [Apium graveolens]
MKMLPVSADIKWLSFTEEAPNVDDGDTFTKWGLYEQVNFTGDSSHYLWYLTGAGENISPNEGFLKSGKDPILTITSAGDALLVLVNGQWSRVAYGSLENPRLTFTGSVKLTAGINKISLLSSSMGLANVDVHFETYNKGVLGLVTLTGLNERTRDLSKQNWSYKVGLKGQTLSLNTLNGITSAEWVQGLSVAQKQPLSWYRATFDAPQGSDPLALDMSSMSKGQTWINGQSVGRYWPAYIEAAVAAAALYYTGQK